MLHQCKHQILDLNIPRMNLVRNSYDFILILHLSPTIFFSFAHPFFVIVLHHWSLPLPSSPSTIFTLLLHDLHLCLTTIISSHFVVGYNHFSVDFVSLPLFLPLSLLLAPWLFSIWCCFFISSFLCCSLMVFCSDSFVLYNVLCVHLVNVSLENHVVVVFSPWINLAITS
jgi:hypothetical protein